MYKRISAEEKALAVQKYQAGETSAIELGQMLGVHRNQIYKWAQTYKAEGILGLESNLGKRYIDKNPVYGEGLKEKAVRAYLAGEGSPRKISQRFGIRSDHALRNWIKVYNSGGDFSRKMGGESRMKKARLSSFVPSMNTTS